MNWEEQYFEDFEKKREIEQRKETRQIILFALISLSAVIICLIVFIRILGSMAMPVC